jgi:Cu-processing system ATP-binding protein
LQDGRLMFHDTVEELKIATGEERLNKVVATMMKRNLLKTHTD